MIVEQVYYAGSGIPAEAWQSNCVTNLSGTWSTGATSQTAYPLSIAKSGTGSGTITSSTGGINCGSTCSASLNSGASVTLNANPATGSTFRGWSGACTGTGACVVTMNAANSVTATFNPAPFAVVTTGVSAGVITAPIATVTTTIAFNAPDVGRQGSVFATGWARYGALDALGISVAQNSAESITSTFDDPSTTGANPLHVTYQTLAATDPNSFVLVQRAASGWQLVVDGQLIPYASGVLGDQLAMQRILDSTDTTNLTGSQFCVGYGTSAADMTSTGRMQLVAYVPGGSATGGSCVLASPQSGWWWNPAESGRGFFIEFRGTNAFLASFLYDPSTRASWYASGGPTTNFGSQYSSTLDSYSGGQSLTGTWTTPTAAVGSGGNISMSFTDTQHGTLNWAGGPVPIQRFDFGGLTSPVPASQPETGWWWNPSEGGRGFSIEVQGSSVFIAGYMYDTSGNPIWYLPTGTLNGLTSYQGTWQQYGNGQTLSGAYQPASVVNSAVGSVAIQFTSTTTGLLALPNGTQIPIQRFRF